MYATIGPMWRALGAAIGGVLAAACSPPSLPVDASDVTQDAARDGVAEHGPTVDVAVTVRRRDESPLAAAFVRAERRDGTAVEAMTDGSGVAHLGLWFDGGSWDVTVGKPTFSAMSYLGVDEPAALTMYIDTYPEPQFRREYDIGGTIGGFSDPANHPWITFAWGGVGEPAYQGRWGGRYQSMVDGPQLPPIRLAALERDPAGHLVNGYLAPPIERTGRAIGNVVLTMPETPPTITRVHTTIVFPSSGILSARNGVRVLGAVVGSVAPSVELGVSDLEPPIAGTSTWDIEYAEGELTPTHFVARFLVVDNVAWNLTIDRHTVADGEAIRVPTIRALESAGGSLGDLVFTADADGAAFQQMQIADSRFALLWQAMFFRPERGASRHLPHLPSAMSFADISTESQLQVFSVSDFEPFVETIRPELSDAVFEVFTSGLAIVNEGR